MVEKKVEAFILAIRCIRILWRWMEAGAMFAAFERDTEPTDRSVGASVNTFVPLSKLMA